MERKSVARQNLTVVLISVLIDIAIFVFAGYRVAVVMGAILALIDGIITLGIYLKAVTGDISYYKDKKIVWTNPKSGLVNRINSASPLGIKYNSASGLPQSGPNFYDIHGNAFGTSDDDD